MHCIRAAALLGGLLMGTAAAPTLADQPPDEKTGLKVGTKAPAFKLKGQDGKEHSLDEFLKKGKVALVFYRSANW
jgi:cytochrome oxidase Cu insertion factor (SCO1/SenC/PrrC family)